MSGHMTEIRDTKTIEWTAHPFRKNIRKSVALLLLLASIIIIFYQASSTPGIDPVIFSIFITIILLFSLRSYFLPTRYRMSDEGIMVETALGRTIRRWETFKRFSLDNNGLFLSPFDKPSRLENFRGLYVLLNGNGSQVAAYVRERIRQPTENISK